MKDLKNTLMSVFHIREDKLDALIKDLQSADAVKDDFAFNVNEMRACIDLWFPKNNKTLLEFYDFEISYDSEFFELGDDYYLRVRPGIRECAIPQPVGFIQYCHMFEDSGDDSAWWDISDWDVSNVVSMQDMFRNCSAVRIGDLSKWDVSHVLDMHAMFEGCSIAGGIGDISNWNVSNVLYFNGMFKYCRIPEICDISDWKLNEKASIEEMFMTCYSKGFGDLTKWKNVKISMPAFLFFRAEHLNLTVRKGNIEWLVPKQEVVPKSSEPTIGDRLRNGGPSYRIEQSLTEKLKSNFEVLKDFNTGDYKVYANSADCCLCTEATETAAEEFVKAWCDTQARLMVELSLSEDAAFKAVSLLPRITLTEPSLFHMNVDALRKTRPDLFTHKLKLEYDPNYFTWFKDSLVILATAPGGKIPQPKGFKSYANMFRGVDLEDMVWDISDWDMSGITDISCMFHDCLVYSFGDLNKWNVKASTNMYKTFFDSHIHTITELPAWYKEM